MTTQPTPKSAESVSYPVTHLADLTWPAAGQPDTDRAMLVLPLGSTEQHGPHLPLSTDTDIAVGLCDALARSRSDVVVAPSLPYGASGEHEGFPGTVSIGSAALEHVLVEWGRSASATFSRLLVVSAHGGNADAVRSAVTLLQQESRDVMAWMPRWRGDAHAGFVETSLQLSLDASRVALSSAEFSRLAGATQPVEELLPTLRDGGVRAVSPNGVLGDPTGASADEGQRIIDTLVEDLCSTVTAWAGQSRRPSQS